MKHIFFLFLATLLLVNMQAQELSTTTTVYFDSNEWTLTEESTNKLDSLISQLEHYRKASIRIEAHTDLVGSDTANMVLSEKRAESVYARLMEEKREHVEVELNWYGESKPIVEKEAVEGDRRNRRVDVFLSGMKNPVDSVEAASSSDVTDLLEALASKAQEFCITPDKDTVLVCDQGTLIYIKANSFVLGPEYGGECIDIEVKEVFEISDMLYENLATLSDSTLLRSSSMLKIDAFTNGTPLSMRQDLLVLAPGRYPGDSTIALYDGVLGEDDIVNWSRTENPLGFFNGDIFGGCDNPASVYVDESPCPFFFCKIKKFFGFNNAQDSDSVRIVMSSGCLEINREIERLEETYKGFSADQLKDIPREEVSYYVFNRRLGWSNTDWISKVRRKKDFFVNITPNKNIQLKVVFPEQRTIVPLRPGGGQYYYKDLPTGMWVWIVGLKFEDDVPQLALQTTRIGAEPLDSLSFETYGMEELREKLTFFDR